MSDGDGQPPRAARHATRSSVRTTPPVVLTAEGEVEVRAPLAVRIPRSHALTLQDGERPRTKNATKLQGRRVSRLARRRPTKPPAGTSGPSPREFLASVALPRSGGIPPQSTPLPRSEMVGVLTSGSSSAARRPTARSAPASPAAASSTASPRPPRVEFIGDEPAISLKRGYEEGPASTAETSPKVRPLPAHARLHAQVGVHTQADQEEEPVNLGGPVYFRLKASPEVRARLFGGMSGAAEEDKEAAAPAAAQPVMLSKVPPSNWWSKARRGAGGAAAIKPIVKSRPIDVSVKPIVASPAVAVTLASD